MAASCSTRQAWMWSMLLASLSARSRPDRWMYFSVDSVDRWPAKEAIA